MDKISAVSKLKNRSSVSRRRLLESTAVLTGAAASATWSRGGAGASALNQAATPASGDCAEPTGQIIYANPSRLRTLDTLAVYGLQEFQISRQMMEPLVDLTQEGELAPVLAESWEPSDDGKVWTFRLRQGVTFHDGTPFDAESVAATIQRAMSAEVSQHKFAFVGFEDPPVTIIDDYTVEFRSTEPTAALPFNLVTVFMQPAAVASDPQYATEGFDGAIGTGPFKLVEFNVDGDTVMEAYADYWQPCLPKSAELVHRPIPEPSAMVAAVKAGEVDLAEGVSVDFREDLENDPNIQVIESNLWQIDFFILNTNYEPLSDPKVRQAINFAIDREVLTNDVYGSGTPIASYPPRGLVGFHEGLPTNPYDPERAMVLLEEAGYGDGFDLEIIYPAGTYIKDKEVAEFVASQLQAIGIRATVVAGEANATRTGYREGNYQMGLLASIAVTGDADRYFKERMVQDVYQSGYQNEEVNELIRQAGAETDPAQRQALYEQVQEIMWEGPPVIYLYQINWLYAAQEGVEGFTWMPNRIFTLAKVSNDDAE